MFLTQILPFLPVVLFCSVLFCIYVLYIDTRGLRLCNWTNGKGILDLFFCCCCCCFSFLFYPYMIDTHHITHCSFPLQLKAPYVRMWPKTVTTLTFKILRRVVSASPPPPSPPVARAVGVSSVSNERGATMASDESYAVSSSFVLLTLVSMIEMNNVITRQFKVFEMSIPVKL